MMHEFTIMLWLSTYDHEPQTPTNYVVLECSFLSFFRIHRLVERRCGQVVESFGYNEHNGRLEETRKSCQRRPTKFTYAPNSHRVSEYDYYSVPPPPSSPSTFFGLLCMYSASGLDVMLCRGLADALWGK